MVSVGRVEYYGLLNAQVHDNGKDDSPEVVLADHWEMDEDMYVIFWTTTAGVEARRTVPRSEVIDITPASSVRGQEG